LEVHLHQREQESLVGGVKNKPLISGVATINTMQEDPIVAQLLPRLNVDLGARSLVSGVDCNDPEKSPILELFFFLFLHHCDVMHHHASFTLHVFIKSKKNYLVYHLF
jgi:hypothetical protein